MNAFFLSDDFVPPYIQSVQVLTQFAKDQLLQECFSKTTKLEQWLDSQLSPVVNIDEVADQSIAGHCSIIIAVKNIRRFNDQTFLKQFTPRIIEAVNNGKISLFFDHSNEADSPRDIALFTTRMNQIGITNHDMIHWICGNHKLPSKISRISHHKYNYFEVKGFVDILTAIQPWELAHDFVSGSYRQASREARLLSLNETPRPGRVASILSLFKSGIYNINDLDQPNPTVPYLSFGGFKRVKRGSSTSEDIRSWLDAQGMSDLLPYFDKLCDKRLTVDKFDERGNNLFNKVDTSIYRASVLSYVTETTLDDDCIRYTEKSIKPLILGHPVIVSGTRGTIQLIRNLGFSVLDHVIDHAYDSEQDTTSRIRASADSAKDFLERISRGEESMIDQIIPHLQYNLSWGMHGYPLLLCTRTVDLLNAICGMTTH